MVFNKKLIIFQGTNPIRSFAMSKQRQFPHIWNRRHFAKPGRTLVGDPDDAEYKVRAEHPN
jgi:hypothetical protein